MIRLLFISCLPFMVAGCRSPSTNPETIIDNFMKEGKVPGVFVAVVRGDSVLYQKAFGAADNEKGIVMTGASCMELGSISKAFTAEAIYYLHQVHRLDINDLISKYFPGAPAAWSGITIKHLLNHTSGIRNYLLDPRFKASEYFQHAKDTVAEKFFNTISTDSMVRMFYALPLEFSPGATWSYSNTGYYLLGKIAESVIGSNFFDWVKDSLHTTLEMRHTKANELAAKEGCLATGYFLKNGNLYPSKILTSNYAFSAGAWATTGADMITYLKAIHQRTLLSDKAGYDWRSIDTNSELPFTYEGGRFYSTYHGMKIISHAGGTPGFSSSWFYVADKNISIIVLINRQDYAAVDQLALDILSYYEPALHYPGKRLNGEEEDKLAQQLVDVIKAIKLDAPYPEGMTKPLKMFMESDNGKGLWKWFFEKGFPETAYCVDSETVGNSKAYRFRLPLTEKLEYHLTVLVNSQGQWIQIRWW